MKTSHLGLAVIAILAAGVGGLYLGRTQWPKDPVSGQAFVEDKWNRDGADRALKRCEAAARLAGATAAVTEEGAVPLSSVNGFAGTDSVVGNKLMAIDLLCSLIAERHVPKTFLPDRGWMIERMTKEDKVYIHFADGRTEEWNLLFCKGAGGVHTETLYKDGMPGECPEGTAPEKRPKL